MNSEPDLPRQADRSWWLEEALALPEFAGEPTPPLRGEIGADVVILGGGYTGMWTAWFLKEREPAIDVVLLEQDICGGGPSGRNGGFVNGFWDELEFLVERFGDEGRRTAELASRSIAEIGAWCSEHGVDAWYGMTGDVGIASSPAQDERVRETVERAAALEIGEHYRSLTEDEVRERFDSPVARFGVFNDDAAHVQPARLARALRRVLLESGVRIFERSPVLRFKPGSPVEADVPTGTVRAGRAVLGINAWAVGWPTFRRSVMVRGTYIVVTAPAPEALEKINWTRGEGVYDFRTALHYLRTTPDGRIAFGGSGQRVAPQRIVERYRYDEASIRELVADFRRWFPTFADVPLEAAWGGPVDASAWHLPFFGTTGRARNVHHGLGFTGNGVGPCHLGGKILSGLALGIEDDATSLPLVDAEPKPFPRQPVFTPGERLVTHAILRKDRLEDEGLSPHPITRLVASVPRRLGYNLGP
jgi:glycine/D-amino acid oxidase-like deaminating enzyme